jgi:hypothetical protein
VAYVCIFPLHQAKTVDPYVFMRYHPSSESVLNSMLHRSFHIVAFLSAITLVAPVAVSAASVTTAAKPVYAATVSKTDVPIDLKPGEKVNVKLKYTNTGTATWKRSGVPYYVALYVIGKTPSPLATASWFNDETPGKIVDASVKPGQFTYVRFSIQAPNKAGTYLLRLRLAAEGKAWMRGAETLLTVRVKGAGDVDAVNAGSPDEAPAPATTPSLLKPSSTAATSTTATTSTASALLLLRSVRELAVAGNARQEITLGFKNTGAKPWSSRGLRAAGVQAAFDGSVTVRDDSWLTSSEPVKLYGTTMPGEIAFITFTLKAPRLRGTYRASFMFTADGKDAEGGLVDIPITVTADGIAESVPLATPEGVAASGTVAQAPTLIAEPILRVGVFATTDDQMKVRGVTGDYQVRQGATTVCTMKKNDIVIISFDRANKVYRAAGEGCTSQSTNVYVVQGIDDPNAPLELTDFSRPVSWLPGANDNKFRASLELRWSSVTDAVWVINELPMEFYLKGMAETSDVSPLEFQKTLMTAARTYAFYHWRRATKHADEGFHVDSKYDQVYRGYGAEARSPNIAAGIDATRGQIVTYNGELAITPYFSRSDGRTRNWTEVWGGKGFPWLIGVSVPQDNGKILWGHGVGMSASGALVMAAREGKLYDEILRHFYTGTGLMRMY